MWCHAGPDEASTTEAPPAPPAPKPEESVRIRRTLADLDALLGLQDDPKASGGAATSTSTQAPAGTSATSKPGLDLSISPEALKKLADSEAQRLSGGDASKAGPLRDDMEVQFQRIVEKARKLADEQTKSGGSVETEQQQLRQEFESLLQTISNSPATLDKDDIKRLKEAAFGPQTFFITETQPINQADRTGLLIRGNLRDERSKIFALITQKVAELFNDKYTVIMVEDEQSMQDGGGSSSSQAGSGLNPTSGPRASGAASRAAELNTPRIAFQVIPSAQALPPQTNGWKQAIAFVLALLFLGSCGQLALAANITKLPKETLDWFSNPANFESDALPPGLESWDPMPYFATAAPIFSAVLGVNVTHEVGHRIAAAVKGVKLGPTFFVPNFQIGSFGAITPFTSMLKDRLQLWDVAAAGPLAGVLFSASLLVLGLAQSQGGNLPAEAMVPVPTQLFQGSLLLGSLARLVLGEAALHGAEVPVSPLVIAGWCGLITQALQVLPVGSVDGGRMVQAAYGKSTLALTSFFTYVGLGLGLLGSSLSLPYGLYVIICQRTAEKYVADNVTPVGDARATATAVALLVAILILVPMAPELADSFGVGPGRDAFL